KLYLKLVPPIYHKQPAQEQDYALFVAGAKLVRKDSLSVCNLSVAVGLTVNRNRCVRKGENNKVKVVEEMLFTPFWNEILIPNLNEMQGVTPVHTAEEIALLHSRFPDNVRQFNVYYFDELVAGTTIFETDTVAHAQYISGKAEKNNLGGLDYLFYHLITNVFK